MKVVKILAKKRREEEAPIGAPLWMATFSDLMNLLLCFFVMLFAISTVDTEKFEDVVGSFNTSFNFNIFEGGGSAIGQGELINSGITQLDHLNNYFEDKDETSAPSDVDGESDSEMNPSDAMSQIQAQKEYLSKEMYDELSELNDSYELSDEVELGIDEDFNYVQISLSGSVLFDSGSAEIKKEALPILSKIGDILKIYDKYQIEIEGHTDNMPITNSSVYQNNNWLSSARALNTAEYLIKVKGLDAKTLKYSGRGEYEPIASNSTDEGRAKNRRVEIKIYNELSRH